MWPDGHSSQHYDMPAAAVDAYLLTGNPDSLRLAYLLTQHWANQSFIYTDVPGGTQHAIRYEKGHFLSNASGGELGRPGNAGDSPPRESHAWGAVSYTHLDVYKRQPINMPVSGLFLMTV